MSDNKILPDKLGYSYILIIDDIVSDMDKILFQLSFGGC